MVGMWIWNAQRVIKCHKVWGFLIELNLPEAFLKVNHSQHFAFWWFCIDIIGSVGEKWVHAGLPYWGWLGPDKYGISFHLWYPQTWHSHSLQSMGWIGWQALGPQLAASQSAVFLNSSCWWTGTGLHGTCFWGTSGLRLMWYGSLGNLPNPWKTSEYFFLTFSRVWDTCLFATGMQVVVCDGTLDCLGW